MDKKKTLENCIASEANLMRLPVVNVKNLFAEVSSNSEYLTPSHDIAAGRQMTEIEKMQEFFLPVHDDIRFSEDEEKIIDHPAFQRLSGMHQLGLAHLVYRGATHRRIEHCLGTVAMAKHILDALSYNIGTSDKQASTDKWHLGCPPTSYEIRFIRLAALLHDIGHVPFGHTFEDELGILNKHDQIGRLNKVLGKSSWYDEIGESLADLIDRLYGAFVPPSLPDRPTDLFKRIILHDMVEESSNTSSSDLVLAQKGLRISICRDIVGNTICADLLDYIHRDWYHIGKPKHIDKRLFHYMEIRTPREAIAGNYEKSILPTKDDCFVISVGNRPHHRSDGVTSITNLLECRYELTEAVLFHRTKMNAAAMLERALMLVLPIQNVSDKSVTYKKDDDQSCIDLEDWLIEHSEEELIPALREGRQPFSGNMLPENEQTNIRPAQKLAAKLLTRNLYNRLLSVTFGEISVEQVDRIQDLYGDGDQAAYNRSKALRCLEMDFKLPVGSVAMYCPAKRMNSKIAEVRIFTEGKVHKFDEYENQRQTKDRLSRGHLAAQLMRFDDLWRVMFFIDPDACSHKSDIFLSLLINSIRTLILGIRAPEESDEGMVSTLSQRAVACPEFHLYNHTVMEKPSELVWARQDESTVTVSEQYPTGSSMLLSFING